MAIQEPVRPESPPKMPLFHGSVDILELIQRLYRRPRVGDYSKFGERREASKGIPMLCLVRPEEIQDLLPAIAERLKNATPRRIPHAFIADLTPLSAEPAEEPAEPAEATDQVDEHAGSVPEVDELGPSRPDVMQLRDLLVEIADKLADPWNAQSGKIRFPRLSLAVWLMDQDLSGTEIPRRRGELRTRLWRRDPAQRLSELIDTHGSGAPETATWSISKVAAVIPWIWFQLKKAGLIPGLGKVYRWFRRQPYLAPEVPGTFIGFAERLTKREWPSEAEEQVARFLTNAFLEDLRRCYGRMPWRWGGARWMSYPIVLLDNVTRFNGGYDLLRLINDIRNDTGQFDPLLLISASTKVPPHAVEPTVGDVRDVVYEAHEAEAGYRAWRKKLALDRRQRNAMTWYLPISTPTETPSDTERSAYHRDLAAATGYVLDRPPWWSRRIVPLGMALVLLAGLLTGYAQSSAAHCGGGLEPFWLRGGLTNKDGQCIGVTDGTFFFDSDPQYREYFGDVWEIIHEQNNLAVSDARRKNKELITLTHFGEFTSTNDNTDGLASQREVLTGIAVAQKVHNEAQNDERDTFVRVLMANGGEQMQHGYDVAKQLGQMAREDPSMVGVVGLNHSNENMKMAIKQLTTDGLPMVASTLSADEFARNHRMYYQVSPQNSRQAKVAAGFAEKLRDDKSLTEFTDRRIQNISNEVRIYYDSHPENLYSNNLKDDLKDELRAVGFEVDAIVLDRDLSKSGTQSCRYNDGTRYDGLVYYAGAGVRDFADFLRGIKLRCDTDPPPTILASDDVTRHVADHEMRKQVPEVDFFYQSFAVAPSLGSPEDDTTLGGREVNFYCRYNNLLARKNFGKCSKTIDAERSYDGHAALGHDAALTMLTAVEDLVSAGIDFTPGVVWGALNNIRRVDNPKNKETKKIEGATGTIDFGRDILRHVPLNKPISILKVKNGDVEGKKHSSGVVLYGYCGHPQEDKGGEGGDRGGLAQRVVQHRCPPVEQ